MNENSVQSQMQQNAETRCDAIVSLTSYKRRLGAVPIVVKRILDGSLKPHKIVLTLFKDDIKFIPKELRHMIDEECVELIVCDEDLRPHKKYFYVMKKYRNVPIITIDDDVLYTTDLVESLYNGYLENPDSVVCRYKVCVATRGANVLPYAEWKKHKNENHKYEFPLGRNGVLYPPNCYDINDEMLSTIRKYITVDDIFLGHLLIKNNKNLFVVKCDVPWPPDVPGYASFGLWKNENQKKNKSGLTKNDLCIKDLICPLIGCV